MIKRVQTAGEGQCKYKLSGAKFCGIDTEKRDEFKDIDGKDYCLFHSHNDSKKGDFYSQVKSYIQKKNREFEKNIKQLSIDLSEKESEEKVDGLRDKHRIDFDGFYFPPDADFRNINILPSISMFEALFSGEAVFYGSKFGGIVDFAGTNFNGIADFFDTEFNSYTVFSEAKFNRTAHFQYTKFENEVNFRIAKFCGETNFTRAEFRGDADFSQTEFRGKTNFMRVEFSHNVDFSDALFKKSVCFRVRRFGGEANFYSVEFKGTADFKSAKFENEAIFKTLRSSGEANFSHAKFKGGAVFWISEFIGVADFSETEFGGKALFYGTKFNEEANFSNAVFGDIASFPVVNFNGQADFFNAKFENIANFTDNKFNEVVSFSNSKFSGEATFVDNKFTNNVYFDEAVFIGDADFSNVKYEKNVDFRMAKFESRVSFYNTSFYGEADFSSKTFIKDLSNIKKSSLKKILSTPTEFKDKADFRNSIFRDKASFENTYFKDMINLDGAAFISGFVDFSNAVFSEGKTFFHRAIFNCEARFHRTVLKGVRFTNCYIGSCSFLGSDVRDAVFINSTWDRSFLEKQIEDFKKEREPEFPIEPFKLPKLSRLALRKSVLYDEIEYLRGKKKSRLEEMILSIPKSFKYLFKRTPDNEGAGALTKQRRPKRPIKETGENGNGKAEDEKEKSELDTFYLESLYCQFKLNMDKSKSYVQANDFYFGEKLMERKNLWREGKKKWRNPFLWLKWLFLWFYWFLSGYGNRPIRAVLNFIGIIALASLLLVCTNAVQPINKNPDVYKYQNLITSANTSDRDADISPRASAITLLKSFFSLLRFPAPCIPQSIEWNSFTGELKITRARKESSINLSKDFWDSWYYVTMWNITATPALQSGDYKARDSRFAHFCIFLIQWIYRPLMITLVIISVRRKIKRG